MTRFATEVTGRPRCDHVVTRRTRAIVSGVGPGLGQANAKALAREGATVVLATRSADYLAQTADEIVADGGNRIAVPTNITDRVPVRRAGAALPRRLRPARRAGEQRLSCQPVPQLRSRRPRQVAQDPRRQRVGDARAHPGVCAGLEADRGGARRRGDRVHPLDEPAQDPRRRDRLLVVEGRAAHRDAGPGLRARTRPRAASTRSRRAGSAARRWRCTSVGWRRSATST